MLRKHTIATGRTGLKNLLAGGLYQAGALRAFRYFSRSYEIAANGERVGRLRRVQQAKYLVLGYHRVGTEGPPLYCTLPQKAFEAQIRYITQNFRVISVRQMAQELQNGDGEGQAVVVTFDDGYVGTFTEAFPVLRDYGVPATVYLTGEAIESGEVPWYDRIFLRIRRAQPGLTVTLDKPHTFELADNAARLQAAETIVTYLRSVPDEQRRLWCDDFARAVPLSSRELRGAMLTWEQIQSMQHAGITFGAHTMTHPVVSRLSASAMRQEIEESKHLVEERLQVAVDDFAFPFGKSRECGTAATAVLKQLGFSTAVTTIVGLNQPGSSLHRLRRFVLGNDTSIARFALQLHSLFFHPVDDEQPTAVA